MGGVRHPHRPVCEKLSFIGGRCLLGALIFKTNHYKGYWVPVHHFKWSKMIPCPQKFRYMSWNQHSSLLLCPDIAKNRFSTAAILKIQYGRLRKICANGNMDFQILDIISFPKMYRFANLHKKWTKLYKWTQWTRLTTQLRTLLTNLYSFLSERR